ncbi:hypothetical protein GCM10010293_45070 [Streptomyces griseoflavus]|nr:hypothetical protein GCM10010293_45070 [Streptomyces griseoflavus]
MVSIGCEGVLACYTGASLGYQLATTLGAGLAPLIATSLQTAAGGGRNTGTVSLFIAVVCLVSAVAIALTRETHRAEIGTPGVTSGPARTPADTVPSGVLALPSAGAACGVRAVRATTMTPARGGTGVVSGLLPLPVR